MKLILRIFKDETLALRLKEIASNLGRLAPSLSFSVGKSTFVVSDRIVISPASYEKLGARLTRESSNDDEVFLFTEKPYDNNYFWDAPDGPYTIISLYGWDQLTSLSRNNGAVYFICALLVRLLDVGSSHCDKNTGCINDFWQDKSGIDVGMRSAFICAKCLKESQPGLPKNRAASIAEIQAILSDLSAASRTETDICDYWKHQTANSVFDVFMCHNSEDKEAVRQMDERLQKKSVKTWLDEEQLRPGLSWQDALEEQIGTIQTAAVFVGSSGVGPWQDLEIKALLQQFLRRRCPVIPVILPDCTTVPQLPLFLTQLQWVDFRKAKPDPMALLLWGVTGKKQSAEGETTAPNERGRQSLRRVIKHDQAKKPSGGSGTLKRNSRRN